ncbi:hypothetical protein C1645_862730 [Glomus cerebriforme]|uniref:Trypsin-like cysteine/serine peptidase domain-containing protein n=1 Tax=Glomus cerebriforme TaxID=658196 RepID=A0A397S7M9_9GLOM|nr:hypothetical protein C1645_862730 [Glomus cerebriforme]
MTLPHRTYQNTLVPGISISSPEEPPSASTLGAFFKTDAEPGKKFMLTVKHAVGEAGASVIQPGKFDGVTGDHIAVVSKYYHHGVDERDNIIDYAFCEIKNERKNHVNNRPFHTDINITYLKRGVSNHITDRVCVQKVGRKTAHTYGLVHDRYKSIRHDDFRVGGKPLKALIVESIDRSGDEQSKLFNNFGVCGDSGASVFDENGCLWGILQGTKIGVNTGNTAIIIPIDLILNHAKKKFNVEFELI